MCKWRSPSEDTQPSMTVAFTLGRFEPRVKYPRRAFAPTGEPVGALLNNGETT
jgi:hypothetical protein